MGGVEPSRNDEQTHRECEKVDYSKCYDVSFSAVLERLKDNIRWRHKEQENFEEEQEAEGGAIE